MADRYNRRSRSRDYRESNTPTKPDLGSLLQIFEMFSPDRKAERDVKLEGNKLQNQMLREQQAQIKVMQDLQKQQFELEKTKLAASSNAEASQNALKVADIQARQKDTETLAAERASGEAARAAIESAKLQQDEKLSVAKLAFDGGQVDLGMSILEKGVQAIPEFRAQMAAAKQQQKEFTKALAQKYAKEGKPDQAKILLDKEGITPEEQSALLAPKPVAPPAPPTAPGVSAADPTSKKAGAGIAAGVDQILRGVGGAVVDLPGNLYNATAVPVANAVSGFLGIPGQATPAAPATVGIAALMERLKQDLARTKQQSNRRFN